MLGSLNDLADVQEQDREDCDSCEGRHEVHYRTSPLPARCGSWKYASGLSPRLGISRVIVVLYLRIL